MHLSIKLKLALTVVGGLGLVALVNAGIARHNYQQDMRFAAEEAVGSAARAFSSVEKREIDKLSSTLDALLGNPTLAAFFAQRDRDHLYEAALPIFQELRTRHAVTHWYFIDPPPGRSCFLRVHRPDLHDDPIDRITFQTAVRTSETAAGKELGQTAFALRVVRAFRSGGKLLGYMELGQEIDDFLARMRAETGSDFGLVVEKRFLDEKAWAASRSGRRNNWGDDPETVAIDATSADLPIAGSSADVRSVPDGGRYLETVARGSSLFVRGGRGLGQPKIRRPLPRAGLRRSRERRRPVGPRRAGRMEVRPLPTAGGPNRRRDRPDTDCSRASESSL